MNTFKKGDLIICDNIIAVVLTIFKDEDSILVENTSYEQEIWPLFVDQFFSTRLLTSPNDDQTKFHKKVCEKYDIQLNDHNIMY